MGLTNEYTLISYFCTARDETIARVMQSKFRCNSSAQLLARFFRRMCSAYNLVAFTPPQALRTPAVYPNKELDGRRKSHRGHSRCSLRIKPSPTWFLRLRLPLCPREIKTSFAAVREGEDIFNFRALPLSFLNLPNILPNEKKGDTRNEIDTRAT